MPAPREHRVINGVQLRVARCGKCQAPIIWTVTARNKRQPVDADPVPDGTIRLMNDWVETDRGTAPRSRVVGRDDLALFGGTELYIAHHATCPFADEFRKPKERR